MHFSNKVVLHSTVATKERSVVIVYYLVDQVRNQYIVIRMMQVDMTPAMIKVSRFRLVLIRLIRLLIPGMRPFC